MGLTPSVYGMNVDFLAKQVPINYSVRAPIIPSRPRQSQSQSLHIEALLLDAPKTYPGMVALSKPNLWQLDNFP